MKTQRLVSLLFYILIAIFSVGLSEAQEVKIIPKDPSPVLSLEELLDNYVNFYEKSGQFAVELQEPIRSADVIIETLPQEFKPTITGLSKDIGITFNGYKSIVLKTRYLIRLEKKLKIELVADVGDIYPVFLYQKRMQFVTDVISAMEKGKPIKFYGSFVVESPLKTVGEDNYVITVWLIVTKIEF